jgi:hypothetical protein
MSSDNVIPRKEPGFRAVGTGLAGTFMCAKCSRSRQLLGRRKLLVRGVKQWVGACCVPKDHAADVRSA